MQVSNKKRKTSSTTEIPPTGLEDVNTLIQASLGVIWSTLASVEEEEAHQLEIARRATANAHSSLESAGKKAKGAIAAPGQVLTFPSHSSVLKNTLKKFEAERVTVVDLNRSKWFGGSTTSF